MRRPRRSFDDDPFAVLGIAPDATADEVALARRRLSKSLHPDIGGSVDAMQRVNRAAEEALRRLGAGLAPSVSGRPHGTASDRRPSGRVRHDHPSFTIEALPAEAFEGLLVVAGWLGEVIDDDPPYALEVALLDPLRGWCRLDVVPDAGACTVSLAVAGEPGRPAPDVDVVRDAWIDALNRLDWTDPDRLPPS